ncbi:transcriptional regulator [Vibrio renipiscarius]|uniref:winged helix-turn-helix domain-containing protein n=1 Tax=Vibrio renipiscarius TaxID=1461322 RepID=UPI00354E84A3
MDSEFIKLGIFYWEKDSRKLFTKNKGENGKYHESSLLTQKQFDLLNCLLDSYPETVTKEKIIEQVWQTKHISSESLPQLIIRTRQVLKDKKKAVLINEPGIGYRINLNEEEEQENDIENQTIESDFVNPLNEPRMQSSIVSLTKKNLNGSQFSNVHNASFLACIIVLIGLALFQSINMVSAIHYKVIFEDFVHSIPYPYITQKSDQTIITIENNECIYNKDKSLLNCS